MLRLAAFLLLALRLAATAAESYPYAPAPPETGPINNGSNAVAFDDPRIRGWANGFVQFTAGLQQIDEPTFGYASFGVPENALFAADARPFRTTPVVSLGERGSITLTLQTPIADGPGYDFAVFENGLNDSFLELAFVEVSTNGTDFVRFPNDSRTPTDSQINGDDADPRPFGGLDPKNLFNLAGKYRAGFGTPFELKDLLGLPNISRLNLQNIKYVRVIDVVGRIEGDVTRDSNGHIINDPWSTPYETSGFDLDGVAVLNTIPEPAAAALLAAGVLLLCTRPRHRRSNSRGRE
jgi:hypothetical protein